VEFPWFRVSAVHGWLRLSYLRLMTEDRNEQFTARSGRDLFVEDSSDYDDDAAAEIDSEDFGFQLDDVATAQDQGDSGTADAPQEPEEVS
jgi:hypothetical protein